MMYENFVPERLAKLRTQKGVSARDMSLSLGQANNYINNIENKKSLPSMPSFFYICEYLGVTPQEFFDEGNANPEAYSLQCGYTISRKVGISHFKTLIQYPYAQNKGMMNPP